MIRRQFLTAIAAGTATLINATAFGNGCCYSDLIYFCPCKGIERLTTDRTKSYVFKAGTTNVVVPLLKMTDKQAVEYANDLCAENRTCKVYIVKSTKGDLYGVFTIEVQ